MRPLTASRHRDLEPATAVCLLVVPAWAGFGQWKIHGAIEPTVGFTLARDS